jgi:hypothetical protein
VAVVALTKRVYFYVSSQNVNFLSLEIKLGAFNMIPKAEDKFVIEAADIPTTHESSHIEITKEDNAHHFLRYHGYCSL